MGDLRLNDLRATSVRFVLPWRGAWLADVDVDLGTAKTLPSGKAALLVGSAAPLVCSVDPKGSGPMGAKGRARVLGGGGGWSKPVGPKHYHNDLGVLSTAVLSTTAAEVGESVVELAPTRLGPDYVRGAGPASSVLAGLDWYVTPQGVTMVGPRAQLPAGTAVEVLSWDPGSQRAELAAAELVQPGTILVDQRFGTAVVRDVVQTFGEGGGRATAWCSSSASSRLVDALARLVVEKSRSRYLARYRYRVVLQGVDERLALQAVERAPGLPDMLPIAMWGGVPGMGAKLVPGVEVLVEFIAGDPSRPVVTGFDGKPPVVLELTTPTLAVTGLISAAGITAGAMVASGGGMSVGGELAESLVMYDAFATWAAAVVSACAAHAPPITIPPFPTSGATTQLKGL